MNKLVEYSGVRYGLAAVLGLMTAFSLTVLMYLLILNDDVALVEPPPRKISDIWQIDRQFNEGTNIKLPEKIDEPGVPPVDLTSRDVALVNLDTEIGLAAVNFTGFDLTTTVDIGLGGGFAHDTDYIPLHVPQPMYPRRALLRGQEGYAVIEIVITVTGGVRAPELLEEQPVNYGFGQAALKAANKLKYSPRVIDGKAEEVFGVIYKFSFELED